MEFDDWYQKLRQYMAKITGNDGAPLDPDHWCEKSIWLSHFERKITPEQAFIEEC